MCRSFADALYECVGHELHKVAQANASVRRSAQLEEEARQRASREAARKAAEPNGGDATMLLVEAAELKPQPPEPAAVPAAEPEAASPPAAVPHFELGDSLFDLEDAAVGGFPSWGFDDEGDAGPPAE